ncbi:DUF1127 domain-containing protein [Marinovum sp. 2_MG-2023]|uniref:DUF1127 domain-containing protein n=1 Tax=Roseobacteraceae TaxID=2854170 RepID=UPI001FD3E640|nr:MULTISPECIES: DUF1127 domain-containing protein [Roseobacteraceae]MCJ7872529.1 DUF1127 domain-containing protein [Phaeobacter sp. J2-8]MDO6731375.1 DUF1127 domain-containing protein [Marinovum sp. 2_MG-2023]MDO6780726.1 DUF1127 domain-containing protein [Marinovum sp. 1_MG-2023]
MADITNTSPVLTGPVARVQTMLRAFGTRVAQYRVYRDTLHELQMLSVRELNDLGVSQSEIRRVAYEAAYH